jgi:hypothetical protein
MNTYTIHVSLKPGNETTMCGIPKEGENWISMHDADQMDGLYRKSNARSLRTLPPIRGPKRVRFIRECHWCPGCWEHPRRAIRELKDINL